MSQRSDAELRALADEWIESYDDESEDEGLSIWDKTYALVRERPEDAWSVIVFVTSQTSDDRCLAHLAAGPVEDLFVYHGAKFIDRAERSASLNPTFKRMLGAVWKNDISDDIWKRIQLVAGPSF